jgi:hypothetical protein
MHADLIAAIKAKRPRVHLVTVTLADYVIRWTDGGAVPWGANVYTAHDTTYGALDSIGDITDGIDDDASPVSLVIIPPTLASIGDITAADAQGGRVEIHLGALGTDGLLVSEPYRLHIGELDQPTLRSGRDRRLEYDIITADARALEPNEEQRQTDSFHQFIWSGERGNEFATDGTKYEYWRADEPRQAIGAMFGRGKGDLDSKAREFTYRPDAPLAFPFGECLVSGEIRYRKGYGPTNRWFSVFATAGASGPIDALISASFDDEITTFDGNKRATSGSHVGEMWFSFLPGAQPSAALTSPTGTNAAGIPCPGWTTAHKLSGRPAFCWTGKENSKESEFRGGVPKPILRMRGLLGYDPLLDSTYPGGSGSCRLNDPSTWVWLNEGCRIALNWAIGRWEGPNAASPTAYGVPYESILVGGIGAPLELIDVQSFVDGAIIADANGWTMAGVPYSDEDRVDVLDDMLKASGCYRARKGGLISCVPYGAVKASSLTVVEADTAAPVSVNLAPSRLSRRNTGIASFSSLENRGEMTAVSAVSNASWVADDGGRSTTGFDYRFVPAADQAAQLCYYDIALAREPASRVKFKPYMLALEAGDCLDWSAPEYLLDAVKARVEKRVYSPTTGLVEFSVRAERDAMHAEALAQTGVAPPPADPPSPPPLVVSPPTGFTSSVIGNSVTLSWANGTQNRAKTVVMMSPTNDFSTAAEVAELGGVESEAMSYTFQPGAGDWYAWAVSRNASQEDSDPAGSEALTVVGVVDPGTIDASDIVVRPTGTGSIVYTGSTNATTGATWGVDVGSRPSNIAALSGSEPILNTTLQTDLTTGSVVPLTFVGRGTGASANSLAEMNATEGTRFETMETGATASDNMVVNSTLTAGATGMAGWDTATQALVSGGTLLRVVSDFASGDPGTYHFYNSSGSNKTVGQPHIPVGPYGGVYVSIWLKNPTPASKAWTYIYGLKNVGGVLGFNGGSGNKFFPSVGTGWELLTLFVSPIPTGSAQFAWFIGIPNGCRVGGIRVSSTEPLSTYGSRAGLNMFFADGTAGAEADFSNSRVENNVLNVQRPRGASLGSATASLTGALKITLPGGFSSTMLSFRVRIFNYAAGTWTEYHIAGYTQTSGNLWINTSASMIGPRGRALTVRFGHDGTNPIIWIGETTTAWNRIKAEVLDFQGGHGSFTEAQWRSGWAMAMDATAATNVASTITAPRAGDAVLGEGIYEAAPGSGLAGDGVVATRAAVRTDVGTALTFAGRGALASLEAVPWGATYITGRPANIAALSGSEGINNASITIGANGTLTGAGSGQVNLASLPGTVGYTQLASTAVRLGTNIVRADGTTSLTEGLVLNSGITLSAAGVLTGGGTSVAVNLGSLAGQVDAARIATGAVGSTQIAASAVTATQIATGAVTATELGTGAVTTAKIAASAVTVTQIADGAISAAKIATGAVGATQIATGGVGYTQLASNAVRFGTNVVKADGSTSVPETDVLGTFRGTYAGDTAANAGGLKNGDTYVDTSVYPPALKAKVGGVISEVGNTGARTGNSGLITITNGAALSKKLAVPLTNLQPRSFVTVVFGLVVTPSTTQRSGAGPASPSGAWELRLKKTADADTVFVLIRSGTYTTDCSGTAPYCTNIIINDSVPTNETIIEADAYYCKPSDRSIVGGTSSMEWQLWLSNTAVANAGNLVDVTATVTVGIERNPSI